MTIILALAFGYLLGSVPFGLLLTRAAGLGDVRSIGSGNIGATNVLRTGRKGLAAATLLLDALKGTFAVILAGWGAAKFGDPSLALVASIAAGFAAFIGHIFPVWLGFKGGKGVATYIGVLLGFGWKLTLIFAIVWLALAFLLRYSSLAALVAAVITPIAAYFLGPWQLAAALGVMTLITLYKHRANIQRLLAGTEPRIGSKG